MKTKQKEVTKEMVMERISDFARLLSRENWTLRDMERVFKASRTTLSWMLNGTYPHVKLDKKK